MMNTPPQMVKKPNTIMTVCETFIMSISWVETVVPGSLMMMGFDALGPVSTNDPGVV